MAPAESPVDQQSFLKGSEDLSLLCKVPLCDFCGKQSCHMCGRVSQS